MTMSGPSRSAASCAFRSRPPAIASGACSVVGGAFHARLCMRVPSLNGCVQVGANGGRSNGGWMRRRDGDETETRPYLPPSVRLARIRRRVTYRFDDTMGRKDREKALLSLMLAFGLWHTCDQWSRVLQPFIMWQLQPRADTYNITLLIAIGNAFILIGTVVVAHLIDTAGCRFAALVVTIVTACYHFFMSQVENYSTFAVMQSLLVVNHFPMISDAFIATIVGSQVENYSTFAVMQSLLVVNHFPMISDAFIATIVGADGDERERTRLLMRMTIPLGISLVAGPWLAVQVMYQLNPSLHLSQGVCSGFLVLTVIPIILFLLPEPTVSDRQRTLATPSFSVYVDMLRNPSLRWTLLFSFLVSAPYIAYDQLSRTHMAAHLLSNPWDMSHLFILLGISTLVTNIFLIGPLQRRFTSQRLVQIALGILTVSYLYLSQVSKYEHLLIGMPMQVIGVCIAFAELTAQVMGAAPKNHVGKAAGLNRAVNLIAATMTPVVAGYYIDTFESGLLCYISAALSLFAFVMVHLYGGFMNSYSQRLPLGFKRDD
uniref:Uncharacterized protein n=1 Tax=Plectus sambesii TaxID=2011161 RepID=A0A914ULZ6_9BILA